MHVCHRQPIRVALFLRPKYRRGKQKQWRSSLNSPARTTMSARQGRTGHLYILADHKTATGSTAASRCIMFHKLSRQRGRNMQPAAVEAAAVATFWLRPFLKLSYCEMHARVTPVK